jgi:argininosuccinate lyase
VATDLAEALARAGTPFHQAHQIVGRLVLESGRKGRKPSDWTPEEMRRFAPEFTADFARLFDPRPGMTSRELPGGTGPQAGAAALAEARERLAHMKLLFRKCVQRLEHGIRRGQGRYTFLFVINQD